MKRLILTLVATALVGVGVVSVSAQDSPQPADPTAEPVAGADDGVADEQAGNVDDEDVDDVDDGQAGDVDDENVDDVDDGDVDDVDDGDVDDADDAEANDVDDGQVE